MTEEQNKQVVLAYVEAFNNGDTDTLRRLFTEDAQIYGALGWGGLDEVVPVRQMLHKTFAFQLHTEDFLAHDDTVVARFLERGISHSPFRGQPATGKPSEVVAIEWFTLHDGRIRRRWGVRDSASHFRQMGLPLG